MDKVKTFLFLFLFIVFSSIFAEGSGENIVRISGTESIRVSPNLFYLEDKDDSYSFSMVSSDEFVQKFQLNKNSEIGFGYTRSVYWFYFDYKALDSLDDTILEISYPILDTMEIYYTNKENEKKQKILGRVYPFSKREYKHRNLIISLRDFAPEGRVIMRVKTESSLQLPISIHNQKLFFEKDQYNLAFQLILAGVLGAMLLYNLLLGIALKDKVYFFYLSSTIPASLFILGFNGINAQFLWGDNKWLTKDSATVLLALNNIGILLFARSFLKLKIHHPKMDRFLKVLIFISSLFLLGTQIFSYNLISRILVFFVIVNSCSAIAAGYLLARQQYRPAKIYLLAWGILLLGSFLLALTGFGLIPTNIFTKNLAQLGLGLESILISFALADRIKILEMEKEKAQRESLFALKRAARHKAELELARRIQQSIIPKTIPEIPGLEIAAWYRPMETIGGDFYDFRTTKKNLGFIMADVSGHGVPAAMVVSTVKTAFWFQELNIDLPSDLLKSMNDILSDKTGGEFVTACYAHIDVDNRKLITANAGHSPLWIFRRKTGELISLKPSGKALSIIKDSRFESIEIDLIPGDRILLYTDGLFEASNHIGQLFGEEKIQEFLKMASDLPAKDFGENLLKKVIDWSPGEDKLEDDIAIIVIDFNYEIEKL